MSGGEAGFRRLAWRNRALSLGLALATLPLARGIAPDAGRRAEILYAAVVILGYGHLLGAAWFAGRRCTPRRRGLRRALLAVGLPALFIVYAWALQRASDVALLLLMLAAWHTAENDLALEDCYRQGTLRPRPAPASGQLLALAATSCLVAAFVACGLHSLAPFPGPAVLVESSALVWRALAALLALAAAALAPERAGRSVGLVTLAALLPTATLGNLGFAEAFAVFGLYHLISWGVLLLDRRRRALRRGERHAARGLGRDLATVHAVPAVLCAALFALPGSCLEGPRALVFAPAAYLFWSALHAVQTVRMRRR